MEAEKVVVELIAKVEGFDAKMAQSAATFDTSMNRVTTAAMKAETAVSKSSDARAAAIRKESAQISQAARMLGTQLNDIGGLLSGPTSPFVVPVKQAPAVSNAMKYIQAGAAALGGVVGGLLTSAILASAAAWIEYITKSDDAQDKIDEHIQKLKEQAEQSRIADAAQEQFGKTIEGVTKALDDNEEALKRISEAGRTAAFQAAVNAENARRNTVEIRANTVALIEQAQAQLEVLRAQGLAGGTSLRETGVGAEIGQIEGRLKKLQAALGVAQTELQRAERQFTEAISRAAVERGSESEVEGIRRKYDKLVEAARKRLVAEGAVASEIVKQTAALREQQRVEEEAARKRKSNAGTGQSGRQINEAQARAIVASIGGTVTSGFRTPEHNAKVGGQATSFHLKGQAVDIAKTAGITLAKIVKAFEDQGVRLIEKLDEGDHFHIAFAKRGGSGPSQETLAKRALAAADAAERREQAFQNEMATIDDQLIDARQALITSAEEIARLETEAIEIARKKYADNVQSLVDQRKLLDGEAKELLALNDERAKLRTELVARREAERKFRIQEATAQRATEFQLGSKKVEQDLLESQGVLATTAKQRRDQEKRLLDLQFEMERIQLQAIIAEAERLRVKQNLTELEQQELERANDRALLAAEQLSTLPSRQANAQQGSAEANQSPLQSFFGDIPNTADELNESFEALAAGGLASVVDGITEAVMGMRSWGDVGRAVLGQLVAGLIKLGVQQLLLATVGQTVAAASTAANAALGVSTAAAWAPAAAAVSLSTFGANAAPAASALASVHALSSALSAPKGFLSGGYTGNGPVGSVAGAVHGQEYVFDAAATRRIGVPALEAMRNGAVRPSNAAAVAPRGSGGANLSPEAVATLRGLLGEAIRAVPDVAVYPTLDPGAVMEAALSTTRGRRAFQAHMADYSDSLGGQQ